MPMIDPRRQKELIRLMRTLGLTPPNNFDWQLLDQALVHPSFSTTYNNDQLEFVGDSVLRLAAALFLRQHYGHYTVGQIAELRSYLVSDQALVEIAKYYDLDRYLVAALAVRHDGRATPSMLANAMEALMAALYLNTHDLKTIRSWLDHHLQRLASKALKLPALGNYKLALQELTQKHWRCLPQYRTLKQTIRPDDTNKNPIFTVEVTVKDKPYGQGEGYSLVAAQQVAASIALVALQEELTSDVLS